jgi:Uma2 family endonuclease
MSIFERVRREGHALLRDLDWQAYDALLRHPDVGRLRLTYDRETLELQARSFAHERGWVTLRYVIDASAVAFEIPMTAAGMTTLRRQDLRCGLEPDASYYIRHVEAFMRVIREKWKELDLLLVPPPDLVVELDDPTSTLDRMGIYARLGVSEVWRRTGNQLRFHELQPDGTYRESAHSPTFPLISPGEIMRIVLRHEGSSDTTLWRSLRLAFGRLNAKRKPQSGR